jgi:peptidoglycan/xylan/chitin deacetylase (PgdA/CDA1 family)
MQAITLLYHDVVPENRPEISGFLTPGANRYKLTDTEFRRHLDAVARAYPQPPADILDVLKRRSGPVPLLITFDDGGVSAYHPIAAMLSERGWAGHFLITTDFIGAPGFVTAGHLRELRRQGHVIGSHSCSHPQRMSACSPEQLRDEWRRSTAVLSEVLGEPVSVASIPAGYYSKEVARAADECGIRALFSSEPQRSVWKVGGCTVFGRYCAFAGTPPEWVAGIVRGDPVSRLSAYAAWNGKKILKKAAGGVWLRFRAGVLGSGSREGHGI